MLQGFTSLFACSYPNNFLQPENKYFAVSDLAGAGCLANRLDSPVKLIIIQGNFNFHLRQKVYNVFRTPVKFGMAFLPAEPLYLGYGQAFNAEFRKRIAYVVKF